MTVTILAYLKSEIRAAMVMPEVGQLLDWQSFHQYMEAGIPTMAMKGMNLWADDLLIIMSGWLSVQN